MDPAPRHAFALRLGDDLALRLRERHHGDTAYDALDRERDHLATVFGWAATVRRSDVDEMIGDGLAQFARDDGFQADLCVAGEAVGWLGLHYLDAPGGSSEVGFWLARAQQRRGIATRALRGVLRYLFEARALGRVALSIPLGHGRSERLAQRLGFERETLRRSVYQGPDGLVDVATFGLLRGAWQPPEGSAPLPRFALYVDDELALAPLTQRDAPALHALIAADRARLAPWLPWAAAQNEVQTREFITHRALPALLAGRGFEAGIFWRGALVGAIGLHEVRERPRRGAIGYWLAAEAEGHGVVTRSARALIAKAFGDLGFARLELRAQPANQRSLRVAERLGFSFEGVQRRAECVGGVWVDHAVFGMLPEHA
jgi:ribosomal-protein-serine acetyltransferase